MIRTTQDHGLSLARWWAAQPPRTKAQRDSQKEWAERTNREAMAEMIKRYPWLSDRDKPEQTCHSV